MFLSRSVVTPLESKIYLTGSRTHYSTEIPVLSLSIRGPPVGRSVPLVRRVSGTPSSFGLTNSLSLIPTSVGFHLVSPPFTPVSHPLTSQNSCSHRAVLCTKLS